MGKTEKLSSYGYVVKDFGSTVLDASIKMAFKHFDANRRTQEANRHLEAAFEALREHESVARKKLRSILEPESDLGVLNLSDIIDSQALQSMMEKFFKLTRMDILRPSIACPLVPGHHPLAYPDKTCRERVALECTRRVAQVIETQSPIEAVESIVTCKDGSRKSISWGTSSLATRIMHIVLIVQRRESIPARIILNN